MRKKNSPLNNKSGKLLESNLEIENISLDKFTSLW